VGQVGNVVGQVGNVAGHVGNVVGHVENFAGHVGNVVGHVGNVVGHVGNVVGHVGNVVGHVVIVASEPTIVRCAGVGIACQGVLLARVACGVGHHGMFAFRPPCLLLAALLGVSLAGCSTLLGDFTLDASIDAGPGDAGPGDAGPGDAGPADAGPGDAGPADAGPHDATVPDGPAIDAGRPTDGGDASDGGCGAGLTECAGTCVSLGDIHNCGGCGVTCSGSTPLCGQADGGSNACVGTCPAGQVNCTGTCATLATDPANCGACGDVCSAPNATSSCVGSKCAIAVCAPNFLDCNGNPLDGCEIDGTSSVNHCGTCANACPSIDTCVNGSCQPICSSMSCPGGCCNGATCEAFASQSTLFCGAGGALCAGCLGGSGEVCASAAGGGACACPAGMTLCAGVCTDTTMDGNNCGRCGHGCLGGSCSGGVCQAITFVEAGDTSFVSDLASDGNVVVWTDFGDGTVDQVSTAGGPKVVLADGSQGVASPAFIAIAASGNVYWDQFAANVTTEGVARQGAPNSGSVKSQLPAGFLTHGLVADPSGTSVWSLAQGNASVALFTCAAAGGCTLVTSVASSPPQASNSFGIDAAHAVFGDLTNATVYIFTMGSGAKTTFTGQSHSFVTDDGAFAYWSPSGGVNNPIVRAALTGSTIQTVAPNTAGPVGAIVGDGTNVYFESLNALYYVPLANLPAGGRVAIPLTSIAVDGSDLKYASGALYFTAGNAIYKLATP
jgi:hypothetical protein